MIAAFFAFALAAAPERVLVLDVQGEGVDAAIPVAVRDTLVSHLQSNANLEVLSAEDMRRVIGVEAEKQALGCKADASCLAELAGALGARFLVYGSATRLGTVVVLNLSLFDSSKGLAVARESREYSDPAELPALARSAAGAMFRVVGVDLAPEPVSSLVIVGGSVLGVGVAAAAGCGVLAAVAAADVAEQPAFIGKKASAERRDALLLAAVGGGIVGAAGLGIVLAEVLLE